MNILIDTCVIIDYLQAREPFFDDALNIVIGAANNEYTAFITASSVTDIYYIVHRYTHSNPQTRKYVDMLTQIIGILDTTAEDCINALCRGSRDYEDDVMVETALRSGIDYIVTRNIRDYTGSRVPVLSPDDFLRRTSAY